MIHIAILRRVRPGKEAEFERALSEFFSVTSNGKGSVDAQMIRPLPGSVEPVYGVLRSFPSGSERDKFYASSEFKEWTARIAPLVHAEPPEHRVFDGLAALFHTGAGRPPPNYKIAIVTWVGVTMVTSFVIPVFGPMLGKAGVPFLIANALLNIVIVSLLTWLVMPLLTKAARSWLTSTPS
ncbi:MAG: hypothetical protein SFV32_14870 [Opitutaceae bacterium]|nr:hypothetical protein [Opitutaceae bacterium]